LVVQKSYKAFMGLSKRQHLLKKKPGLVRSFTCSNGHMISLIPHCDTSHTVLIRHHKRIKEVRTKWSDKAVKVAELPGSTDLFDLVLHFRLRQWIF
jgi:hypothetical protein